MATTTLDRIARTPVGTGSATGSGGAGARRADRSGRLALFDRSEAMTGSGTAGRSGAKGRVKGVTGMQERPAVGPVSASAAARSAAVRPDTPPTATPRTPTGSTATSSKARSARAGAAPVPQAARDLLADASLGLARACAAAEPADRYAIAHLAALRAAAAVVAARARPTRGRRGSVWDLMTGVAPEFAEWAAFFAAGSAKRQAVQAGLPAGVTVREADDLARQVAVFLALVGEGLGPPSGR